MFNCGFFVNANVHKFYLAYLWFLLIKNKLYVQDLLNKTNFFKLTNIYLFFF